MANDKENAKTAKLATEKYAQDDCVQTNAKMGDVHKSVQTSPAAANIVVSVNETYHACSKSAQETTVFGYLHSWPHYPPKKFLLMLILFLTCISPCMSTACGCPPIPWELQCNSS